MMKKLIQTRLLVILVICLFAISLVACGGSKETTPSAQEPITPLGEVVKLNAHPTNLEGKTILLRWNGKPNGDKVLTSIAENLTEQVKDVKIIKFWETDPDTAVSSESIEVSQQFAERIAALAPDLVIASQCD